MGIVRLLLALAVVITHCQVATSQSTAARMTAGQQSVEMFYIISGFYMALVLNRKYNWKGSQGAFYLNRVLRLFPTYFVMMALTCGLGWLAFCLWGVRFPPMQVWHEFRPFMSAGAVASLVLVQLTPIAQDWAMFMKLGVDGRVHFAMTMATPFPGWSFMMVPQAWTLGVELLFYLVAPLIVRRSMAFIAVVAAVMLAIRIAGRHLLGLDYDPWTYRFFPFELPLFLMGSLAYKVYDSMPDGWDRPAVKWCAWCAVLLTILLFQKLPDRPSIAGFSWGYFVLAGAMPWIFRLTRSWAWERWIGELSYPLYLGHMTVMFFLLSAGVTHHLALICCAISLALAAGIHLLVESPVEKIREAIGKQRKVREAGVILAPAIAAQQA
jgi:peptidoglycan/LPS O-acetylase OafA/YrhL